MTIWFLAVWMTGVGYRAGQEFTWHETKQEACEKLQSIEAKVEKVFSITTWIDQQVNEPVSEIVEIDCLRAVLLQLRAKNEN